MAGPFLAVVVTFAPAPAAAQPAWTDAIDGHVSLMADTLPNAPRLDGGGGATELRARLFVDAQPRVGERLFLRASGYADGLLADRGEGASRRAAIVRPSDLYVEWRSRHFDLRAGAGRVTWGRLDEFQPGDVVNPLDVSRFLLEGRSESRLAVGMVRGRVYLPGSVTVESLVVPWHRRGRFDQLAEEDSPFSLGVSAARTCPDTDPNCVLFLPELHEPERRWRNVQGGGRVTATVGRVDFGASVYRGLEPFAVYSVGRAVPTFAPGPPVFTLAGEFPRYTMVASDFETVRGAWGIRGEAAWFPDDTLQSETLVTAVDGRTLELGFGADRTAGSYRVSGNVVVSTRSVEREGAEREPARLDPDLDGTEVLLVGSAGRTFSLDTRSLRILAAYDPLSESAFVRGTAAISLRENLWLEVSGAWLTGSGRDFLSRLASRDFLYARLKAYF
ncbi:MAG: hypothetical protein FJW23_05050 [Acidimicrobiia bacterium]|nr:hypothetical protein [Acidimicrobiia bacterium]